MGCGVLLAKQLYKGGAVNTCICAYGRPSSVTRIELALLLQLMFCLLRSGVVDTAQMM